MLAAGSQVASESEYLPIGKGREDNDGGDDGEEEVEQVEDGQAETREQVRTRPI